jgi:diacylglycerol kinase
VGRGAARTLPPPPRVSPASQVPEPTPLLPHDATAPFVRAAATNRLLARANHAGAASDASDGAPVGRTTFLKGFVHAWNGVVYAVRTQRNARVHATIAAAAIALGIALKISPVEFALIFVAITGVFITEMINTVVEAMVDLVTPQYHPLARVAKDVAAGVVLVNAALSVIIGLFVFVPHLWHLWPQIARWLGH